VRTSPALRLGALALLLLAVLGACQSAAPAAVPATAEPLQVGPPLEPLRAVYVEKTPDLLPYWAAAENGYFARNGLAVEVQAMASAQEAYTALRGGVAEVYLAPLTPELMARAAEDGDLAILGGTPHLAVITIRPHLQTREFILERFWRGVLEGIRAVQTQPEAMAAVLARQGVSAAADAARGSYAERVPYLSPDDLTPFIAAGAAQDPRAATLEPDRVLDQALLRRLEASGFISALYRA
jgi:hypothetical protein